jgi:hypothetical protein
MTKPEQVGVTAWRDAGSVTFWNWAEAERDRAPEIVLPLIDRDEKRIVVSYEDAVEDRRLGERPNRMGACTPKAAPFSDAEDWQTIDPPE